MKIIIAGGRDYQPTLYVRQKLKELLVHYGCTEVVSGGATGADALGEELAASMNIPVKRFLPNWNLYGKGAGPVRNIEMARYAEAAILLKGGRGTESMRQATRRAHLPILFDEETTSF